ncbi:TonB-dependent receptor [Halioxenophilus sp. WMMB6]|uniref:TonB-dependent receptor n=1 Tax=Halioxenophilus sp. WMMB6 TaxID=3073815 RepID=UPI00295E96CD|nr:TonB-dependent receptor [Halioxenophilus sp. WMMB6]
MISNGRFHRNPLRTAISVATLPATLLVVPQLVLAEAETKKEPGIEEMIVTATRREESVMDIPINITAVNDTMIEDLRLDGIAEIARYVPGLTVIDRGPRDEVPDIMVRGLNTTGLGPGFGSDTVATYFGNIPLLVDIKPVDLQRVEVLIGPQGTLYGQGTMGGAIRYIPKLADPNEFSGEVRSRMAQNVESDNPEGELGFTINLPLIADQMALRLNYDHLDDPGFIDYNYVVREPGISNPEVASDLRKVADANGEKTDSMRLNLRITPFEGFEYNLWYFNQDTKAEGRQISNQAAYGTGEYESAYRYEEPNHYENQLLSVDATADLGFAEATFVYGGSDYKEKGQRDQTDLLINFEYGYEFFPSFSSYTREIVDEESETVEVRLVSQHEGPLSWVVGYFNNDVEGVATSEEFTPHFDQFAVDNYGGVQLRPDALEYYSKDEYALKEIAYYGELTLQLLDSLSVTVGYRDYRFKVNTVGGFDLPLFRTVFLGDAPDSIDLSLGEPDQGTSTGDLWKANIAWDITDNDLVYFTYSQGYRNGGVNSVPVCTPDDLVNENQALCALESEKLIDPDTIDNYEIGYKGLMLDNRLSASVALYYIDWQDLQVATSTVNGSLPITGNGSSAESKGLEFIGRYIINENWEAALTYSYTNAELTDRADGLVGQLDALSGARLPGHSEHQASFNLTYNTQLNNGWALDVNYGLVYFSDFFNIVGGDEDPLVDSSSGVDVAADYGGEAIDGYDIHHLAATLSNDTWRVQAYIENLFDDYYVLGTRTTKRNLTAEQGGTGLTIGDHTLRSYGEYVGAPRTFGVSLSYSF